MSNDLFMSEALTLAREAYLEDEVPVGCVIINSKGEIIATGRNRREKTKNALAHAEIEAIENACAAVGDFRLDGCSMYVTLEPCPMCAGAIIISRIDALYYGAKDDMTGSCGSVINLFMENYPKKVKVTGAVLEDRCSALLSDFFTNLRGSRP